MNEEIKDVLANALRETLTIYLTLLESGTSKIAIKDAGKTVRHFTKLLHEASLLDTSYDDDSDPDDDEPNDMDFTEDD